jgi:Glycosyltransferase family 87
MTGALRAIDRALDRAGVVLARFARPVRDGLIVVGLARAAYYFFVQGIQPWTFVGVDARAYWQVDLAHPYVGSGVGDVSTYLYSPAFAQVMAPFSLLPFPAFDVLWTALLLVLCAWLIRPWPWAGLILFLPISYELLVGNVHFLIAAAIVLGFRASAIWAFPILTKVTPGLGVLWFAVRREWRAFGIAIGTTAAVVAISFALAPSAWSDWFTFLLASPGRSQLLIPRTVVAAVLVLFGALTGRRWLVPVAIWLALPIVWVNSWVILLAVIRLREREHPRDRDRPPTPNAELDA